MSHSSLGYSFIETTDKIKEKLKPKKKANIKQELPKPEIPVNKESELLLNVQEDEDDSGLANVDFSPPPKPESSGVMRTQEREVALTRDEQHPAKPFMNMASEFAAEYKEDGLVPDMNSINNYNYNYNTSQKPVDKTNELERKLNYMIHLLEDQKDERVEGITEEIVLYCFLGVFIIFVLDSFAKVGKYVR